MKKDIIKSIASNTDEQIMLSSALDKLDACIDRNYLTHTKFLDMRERSLVLQAVQKASGMSRLVFVGGYDDAERVCAVFIPDYMDKSDMNNPDNLPFCVLRASKSAGSELSHRDYLGALMGLGLSRTGIGDILVHEDGADIFVLHEICDFVLMEFLKAGRKNISISKIDFAEIKFAKVNMLYKEGSIASARVDSIISLAFNISRSKAQNLIARGLVYLNNAPCTKDGKDIQQGDKITVRTMGRIKIDEFTGISRKGRLFVKISYNK